MNHTKKIVITVKSDGSNSIEPLGYVDGECAVATAMLTDKMGKTESQILKPEYYAGDGGLKVKEQISKE